MTRLPRRVSVVIPTYNRAELVEEAIASVLGQTTPVHEVIVVDDGSTDSSRELVREHQRPVVLVEQAHLGAATARNHGIARATGDWIAFLDSDDVWKPTKLEKQLEYLDLHPQCGLVHAGYYVFGDRERVVPAPTQFLEGDYRIECLLLAESWICPSAVLVRRGIPVTFREWAACSEDIIFFADLLRSGVEFGYVDEPLVGYRVHAKSLNREQGSQVCGLSSQWRWVLDTYALQPDEQRRLINLLMAKVIRAMSQAKLSRAWCAYWEWRGWLAEHWPPDVPRPEVLRERIYSPGLYEVKDRVDTIVARVIRGMMFS
jgi:glycosyltransferase involved in cell wall biosynthesis